MRSGPDFPDMIGNLIRIGNESFKKETIEGYLASILMFHQVIEESMKVLIRLSDLLLKAHIWPDEINYTFIEERKMFGDIIRELERSIRFKRIDEYINNCRELNKIRIDFVHKLTKIDFSQIENEAKRYQDLFIQTMVLYYEGEQHHVRMLSDLKENVYDVLSE